MMRGFGYGYPYMMGGGWWGIVMLVFWLLVIAAIVVLIVWAVRQITGHGQAHGGGPGTPPPTATAPPKDEACEIARIRYAKGEITKEQFEEICRGLGVPSGPPATPA